MMSDMSGYLYNMMSPCLCFVCLSVLCLLNCMMFAYLYDDCLPVLLLVLCTYEIRQPIKYYVLQPVRYLPTLVMFVYLSYIMSGHLYI